MSTEVITPKQEKTDAEIAEQIGRIGEKLQKKAATLDQTKDGEGALSVVDGNLDYQEASEGGGGKT